MLNYIAQYFVAYFVLKWSDSGSGTILPKEFGRLPAIGDNKEVLIVIIAAVLTAIMTLYLKKSKQGYELTVVGESRNTARYVGINVKTVIIRTMLISGAICGIAGFLLVSGYQYTMSEQIANNMGFTAIIATWMGQCNPLSCIFTCFLIQFLSRGMVDVKKKLGFTSEAIADISVAIVYFVVIACEFFVAYAIKSPKIRAKVDKVWLPVKAFFAKTFGPAVNAVKKFFNPAINAVKQFICKVKNFFVELFTKKKINSENLEKGGNE